RRRRSADRPPQGPRGQPDTLGGLECGDGASAPVAADRRERLRAPRHVRPAPAARDPPPPSDGLRASATGPALAALPRAADRVPGPGAATLTPAAGPGAARRPEPVRAEAPKRTAATGSTGSGRAPTASPARGSRPTPAA